MDHLIELRQRLIYAVVAFFVMFVFCFTIARHIYDVLVWPYVWASGSDHVRLIATHFLEQIFTQLKLAMFGAAFLSFPVVATQVYKFVAPGLYKNERHAFLPYLIATPVFFVLGAMVVYFIAMPILIQILDRTCRDREHGRPGDHRADAEGVGVSVADHDVDLRLRHLLPAPRRADAVGARRHRHVGDTLRSGRRFAIVGIFAVAAILTPPDALQHGHHGAADGAALRAVDPRRLLGREARGRRGGRQVHANLS